MKKQPCAVIQITEDAIPWDASQCTENRFAFKSMAAEWWSIQNVMPVKIHTSIKCLFIGTDTFCPHPYSLIKLPKVRNQKTSYTYIYIYKHTHTPNLGYILNWPNVARPIYCLLLCNKVFNFLPALAVPHAEHYIIKLFRHLLKM